MRILVADDHDLVRETIAMFLIKETMGEVVTVGDLDAALEKVRETGSFDVVLLDYDMPGMSGLSGLGRMIEANDGKPVALLSGSVSAEVADRALKSGASGFIPKSLPSRSMSAAVRPMAAGEVFVPFDFMSRAAADTGPSLTPRETEVLRLLCEGRANKEIAYLLDLQEVTVKLHVKTLSRKIGARNRTHAAMIARDRHLV